MCINLETANNIKPNHIDEKSVSFNYNSCRTKLAISKQSQAEHQDHNNRTFNDLQVTEFKDSSASLQIEPNLLPALDVSGTNVSFMAENNRQKSCNNADCYIPVIDNQPTALLRIPTVRSQPSENDSLSLLNDKQNGYTRQRFYQNNNANQSNYNNNQQQPIPTRITTRKRVKNVGRKSNSKRNECKKYLY